MKILFKKIFHTHHKTQSSVINPHYPWLQIHEQYNTGFMLSQSNVDDGYGYGCMPDITSHLDISKQIIQTVRNHYSWLTILEICIDTFHSSEKIQIKQFSDCTGFSDVNWWIHIPDVDQWLIHMQTTIQTLFNDM